MTAASPAEAGKLLYLIVRAGDWLFALPLLRVRRVLPRPVITPLAGSHPSLSGLAQLGGEPVAVLDLARWAGAPPGPRPDHPVAVLVQVGPRGAEEILALAADAALEIAGIAPGAISASGGQAVKGQTLVGEEVVRVLDLERFEAAA